MLHCLLTKRSAANFRAVGWVGMIVFLGGCAAVDRTGILPGLREARLERHLERIEVAASADLPHAFPHSRHSVREAEKLLDMLDDAKPPREWQGRLPVGRFELVFDNGALDLSDISRVMTPHAFPTGAQAGVVTRPGTGLPVILVREAPAGDPPPVTLIPAQKQSVPGTAVFSFEAASAAGRKRFGVGFADPHEDPDLAVNFSAPLVHQIGPRIFRALRLRGLINPGRWVDETGLYALQPYDPGKVPVVFIHGLNSDPHIWINAANGILGDAALRAQYQIWYFQYPTGLAVPASASRLREALAAVRAAYDPEYDDRALDRTVLVGHSMGGLLARMQATSSGDHFRKAFFRSPIDNLKVGKEWREIIRLALEFEPVPWVNRVIFISTPHRGSGLADLSLARLFEQLIRVPRSALNLVQTMMTLNIEDLNPALMSFRALGLSSIQTLSPRHPYFKALGQSDMVVPFHSIIGVRRRGMENPTESSDGVVPYWSSHLEGAESELFVPYGHGNVERPAVVAEVLRILRLHAGLSPD